MARNLGWCGAVMHLVSIKGIVIGSAPDLVATYVFMFMLGIFLAILHGGDVEAAMLAANSAEWMTVSIVVTSLFTVIAGYLAARIAGRGELINGTLRGVFNGNRTPDVHRPAVAMADGGHGLPLRSDAAAGPARRLLALAAGIDGSRRWPSRAALTLPGVPDCIAAQLI
jgi:hypothetical protein